MCRAWLEHIIEFDKMKENERTMKENRVLFQIVQYFLWELGEPRGRLPLFP